VAKVTGGSNKRVSLAALIVIKPGYRPRLIYRVHKSRGKDQRKGFTEADYAQLLDAARQQLAGPIVVVWDNLNSHVSAAMAELAAARDWLTIYQLPPYAHELNPVEPVWSHLKRSLANMAKRNISELTALVKTRLRRMQYRPALLEGFLASTPRRCSNTARTGASNTSRAKTRSRRSPKPKPTCTPNCAPNCAPMPMAPRSGSSRNTSDTTSSKRLSHATSGHSATPRQDPPPVRQTQAPTHNCLDPGRENGRRYADPAPTVSASPASSGQCRGAPLRPRNSPNT